MEFSLLIDIGIIILFAALGANLSRILKQRLILGYVVGGILVGPAVLGLIKNASLIATLSELGIAFLLFFVGLELDFSKIKKVGWATTFTGIFEIITITILGALVANQFFSSLTSLYIGLILAFSSTMVVLKLLADKREIHSLHGRMVLGILLIQDLIVVILLPLLTNIGSASIHTVIIILIKAVILILAAYLLQKYVFKKLLRYITRQTELLFVTSIALCFAFISLAYLWNFSIAVGGFIAGLALATPPYNIEIAGRVKALKDFFLVLFFVTLGSQIVFTSFNASHWILILGLFLIAVLVKPLIIFLSLKMFKYSNRSSLLCGLSLGQVSEFSLILAVAGFAAGHISQEVFNIIIIVAVVTIVLTGYFIKYNDTLYRWFSDFLIPFEGLSNKKDLEFLPKHFNKHIVLFGADRMGSRIIEVLKNKKEKFVVVDFNPEIIRRLIRKGIHCIYGDYANPEILDSLRFDKVKRVISTIPSMEENLVIIDLVKSMNKKATIVLSAKTHSEALSLYKGGADFVVLPEVLAGQKVAEYMKKMDKGQLKRKGDFYYKQLLKRDKRREIED